MPILSSQLLREFRAEQQLSQRDLGKIIGRTRPQISAMENGRTALPQWLLVLIAICRQRDVKLKDCVDAS